MQNKPNTLRLVPTMVCGREKVQKARNQGIGLCSRFRDGELSADLVIGIVEDLSNQHAEFSRPRQQIPSIVEMLNRSAKHLYRLGQKVSFLYFVGALHVTPLRNAFKPTALSAHPHPTNSRAPQQWESPKTALAVRQLVHPQSEQKTLQQD